MKTRVQLALLGTAFSVLLHLYLTSHYYPLKFGMASGQSVCNLNAKFDCDAVAASAYSSIFGIPLSIWGAITNAVLFLLILLVWLEWSEYPERLKRAALGLAGGSLVASVIMGIVALTQMQNYCLFCMIIYVLSAVVFFAYKGTLQEPFLLHVKRDLPRIWTESKGLLVAFAAIPVLSLMTHRMYMQNLGDEQVTRVVTEAVQGWTNSPKQEFVAKPALTTGAPAESAAMTVVEFADFRCSHCKHASYSLHAFVKSHPDVRFEFYAFPLDGACNEKIQGADGVSCRLASAVYCAEKDDNKGWEMHDFLFLKQDETIRLAGPSDLDAWLAPKMPEMGINWGRLESCLNDPATMDTIKTQAKQGVLVGVTGTPALFANGQQMRHGQMLPVLQAVRQSLIR